MCPMSVHPTIIHTLMNVKTQINRNIGTVGNFNTVLSLIGHSDKKSVRKFRME
jgi:hypothetical protein